MVALFHYLPYVLGIGLAALTLAIVFGGGDERRHAHPRSPRRQYYRWDDISPRRD